MESADDLGIALYATVFNTLLYCTILRASGRDHPTRLRKPGKLFEEAAYVRTILPLHPG